MNSVYSALPTTVFEVVSEIARKTGVVNLGQGFPDDPGPEDVRRKAADASSMDGTSTHRCSACQNCGKPWRLITATITGWNSIQRMK